MLKIPTDYFARFWNIRIHILNLFLKVVVPKITWNLKFRICFWKILDFLTGFLLIWAVSVKFVAQKTIVKVVKPIYLIFWGWQPLKKSSVNVTKCEPGKAVAHAENVLWKNTDKLGQGSQNRDQGSQDRATNPPKIPPGKPLTAQTKCQSGSEWVPEVPK